MMEPIIQFKHEGKEYEFDQIDGRLRFVLFAAAGYMYNKHRKILVITELKRSQEMQDLYYKDNPDYRKKPWQSVHQYGRGADISVLNLTKEEYMDLEYFINSHVIYDGIRVSALVHDVGQGIHFHIQVNYTGITEIKG